MSNTRLVVKAKRSGASIIVVRLRIEFEVEPVVCCAKR